MPRADPPDESAYPRLDGRVTLAKLRESAAHCKACDLWKLGTQTVFGEGSAHAKVMFVGEQPGDYEDRAGRPFVGPAGRMLDEALQAAGIDRDDVWLTNAVKHFKWEPRGKRRIHAKPNAREIAACRHWLRGEIALLKPRVIVCLGATAAQAVFGRTVRINEERGKLMPSDLAPHVLVTIHPSAILRAPDEHARDEQRRHFVADLRKLAGVLAPA
ncbi:MAG: uracil-DNA glycosylase [Chloroflexi bacterium 13_1_40CM_4_68_4]|nr:MAG: uracil-DNA glycosylase [Chloroflexi bacterium 13_1_40CM_4_68_4]